MKLAILGILGILGLFLIAAQNSFAAENSTEKTISRTFNVQLGGDLTVELEQGDIHVTTSNQNTVQVTVERETINVKEGNEESALKKHRVRMTQEGNSVRVEAGVEKPGPLSFHKPQEVTAHVRITVPKRFNVSLSTAGVIRVSGLNGSVDARSTGGNLDITEIDGNVDAHTGGGNINVAGCHQQLTLQTSGGSIVAKKFTGAMATLDSLGGDIEASDCEGKLRVKTSGGDIWISGFVGEGVYAETGGGTILFELAKQPDASSSLRTGGGDIILKLAPEVGINVNASTDAGTARSALPVEATIKEGTTQGHIEGKINGGGSPVMLKTVGGNIEIIKR